MRRLASPLPLLALAALAAQPARAQWSTAALSQARQNPAATVLDGKAFFAGGRQGNTLYDVVDVYDAASDTWTTASLSSPRTIVAATSVEHYALFAGGNLNFTATTDVVDVYDANAGPPGDPTAWSTVTLSQARTGIAATTVGQLAIFAGGGFFNGTNVASGRVDIYDASVGPPSDATAWSTATLSQARAQATAATAGDLAIFAGGGLANGSVTGRIDIYDASVGPPSDATAWSTATLSEPRWMGLQASATAGTRACFAGGVTPMNTASDAIDLFDSQPGSGSSASLSAPRVFLAATALGNTALFAGGNDGAPSDRVDVLNVGTGSFGPLMHLSQARSDLAAASVGGKALFAGGTNGTVSAVVDIYAPVGINYCAAGPNSTGGPASIRASGSGSLAANDLTLTADGVPNQPYLFFHAANMIEVPFGNGLRCAGGGLVRLPIGLAAGNVATTVVDLPSAGITAPGQRHFQCWFRDPAAGGAGYDTSDALTVTFVP